MNYRYLHKPGCGGPAFVYDHMPKTGELVLAKFATHLDGKPVKTNTPCVCDTCGCMVITPLSLSNLVALQ